LLFTLLSLLYQLKEFNNFTLPRLRTPVNADGEPDLTKIWYVYFSCRAADGKMKRIIKHGRINRERTVSARRIEANTYMAAISRELKSGWNPFDAKRRLMSFEQAIEYALNLKLEQIGKSQSTAYGTLVSLLTKWSKANYHWNRPINHIDEHALNTFMEYSAIKHKWTNSTFNSRLKDLRALFNLLVRKSVIEKSPAAFVEKRKVKKTNKNIPLTEKEQKRVVEHFKKTDYNYYMFLAFFYHSGFRPKEVLAVRRKDVDLDTASVFLFGVDSKTDVQRVATLPNVFFDEFRDFVQDIPSDHYVFGSSLRFGHAPRRATRHAISRKWKRVVQDQLGIENQLYSIRHKSASDKYQDGLDVSTIQEFLGHSRITTTEIYLRSIVAYQKKVIREKSRAF
jgi:site-specific recombinase XerD